MKQEKNQQIIIYQSSDRQVQLDVHLTDETIWLTQKQIAELFGIERSVITKHLKNIFFSQELAEKSNVQFLHIAGSDKPVKLYNLDVIISVGYRVNSKRATQFRIWATQTLKKYVLDGFVVNQKRLQEKQFDRLKELEQATTLLQKTIARHELRNDEATGLLKVITDYTESWLLLHKYDEGQLKTDHVTKRLVYRLTYKDARAGVDELRTTLLKKKEAGDLFGAEREHMFESIIGNINQTFGGQELYGSIEEKAAHLLYFIIKDHVFSDGNKRSGAFLFVWFLARNNHLYTKKGEKKINDNALVAIALLIAESDPKEKDLMIKLVVNLIRKR